MSATTYWFGVKKLEVAPVLTAPGTPSWTQVPSIESAMIKLTATEVKAYGDDQLQYVFLHSPEGQITVKLTKLSLDAQALLSGNAVDTSTPSVESILLMTNKDLNAPYVLVRATFPAKDDATGISRDLQVICFKVQFRNLADGMGGERGKGTELNWVGEMLSSTKTETGNNLPAGTDFAFAKLIFPTA